MSASFLFYDLETSGFNPKEARVMQFAGLRTDLKLNPIEAPHNYLIKLTEDVVPDPDAVLITGITPQQTLSEGISEAEFLKIFHEQISVPDTIFVGFNSVRFDDEFMRYLNYRNFYDPYEWQWKEGRSRWDLLDLVRMTRALRPEGIEWPFDSKGNPANRLELLTSVNKLDHTSAHDALSDVMASIELAKLIRSKQPDLFKFLLKMRKKDNVAKLVHGGQPYLYTSGKYASEWEKTTTVATLAEHPERQGVLVYDLRYDPKPFAKLNPGDLAEAWRRRKDEPGPRLPVKTLKFNRCPAIAPLSVLDESSEKRLNLSPKQIQKNFTALQKTDLAKNVLLALELLDEKYQAQLLEDEGEVDTKLYEGFVNDPGDKNKMSVVRAASIDDLAKLDVNFKDQRLQSLVPLYKARNFPRTLTDEERAIWERFKERKILGGKAESRLNRYFARIAELETKPNLSGKEKYLLEELKLYGQSITPFDA